MITNKQISRILRSVAATYLLTNDLPAGRQENRFKVIAYERAADTIDHLNRELYDIWENGQLFSVKGIGPSILSHIDEFFRQGDNSHLIKIIRRVPSTVFVLMDVPHIGPKKAYKLVSYLKLTNPKTAIEDLYKACLKNKIAQIETFGEKSQREIKEAIEIFQRSSIKQERMPLPYAYNLAKEIVGYLAKHHYILRVDVLGSLRRMTATIGDIDIAVQIKNHPSIRSTKSKNYREIIKYFTNYPKTISVLNAGESKASILVSGNRQIDLRIQEKESYGSMLQYFTGN